MKRISFNLLMLLALLATLGFTPSSSLAASDNYVAVLTGADEVPPRDTDARGIATFRLNKDGTKLAYTLAVGNMENVVAAHIHCGASGVNASVGVTLYSGGVPGGGRSDGLLANGTISTPDPSNGCGWASLAQVVAAIESGNTYVNVHTNDGVAPTNTGPGDFPGGEIRGQIQ